MSWGIRITILYLAFVIMIGTLVYMTTQQKSELVSEDYYQQEINYQQTIDRSAATIALDSQPQIKATKDEVQISFPAGMRSQKLSGHVLFLRPSDATHDLKEDLRVDSNATALFARSRFITGLYAVKMDWQCGDKKYYNEFNIYVP